MSSNKITHKSIIFRIQHCQWQQIQSETLNLGLNGWIENNVRNAILSTGKDGVSIFPSVQVLRLFWHPDPINRSEQFCVHPWDNIQLLSKPKEEGLRNLRMTSHFLDYLQGCKQFLCPFLHNLFSNHSTMSRLLFVKDFLLVIFWIYDWTIRAPICFAMISKRFMETVWFKPLKSPFWQKQIKE